MTLWARKECKEYNEFNCFEELKGRSNEQKLENNKFMWN